MSGWLETLVPGPVVVRQSSYDVPACNGQIVAIGSLGAACTVRLPAAPVLGQIVVIKRMGTVDETITVDGNGKTIDGYSTLSTPLGQHYACLWLCYNGSAWSVLGTYYAMPS
jgi:hypothetical protein